MAGASQQGFTGDHAIRDDRAVAFTCSRDERAWPWLALGPRHPVVLLTALYWASVESSRALGVRDEGKWSALTFARWDCGEAACGALDHGLYRNTSSEDALAFTLDFFDADGACVTRFDGRGVVFRTRNFEGWRTAAKPRAPDRIPLDSFGFAPASALGLGPHEKAFLAPLDPGGASCSGLIGLENGMPPHNPFLSGSGDHVNATHLAEAGRQFVSALHRGAPFEVARGEMTFDRYVELGLPFTVERVGGEEGEIRMIVRQSDRDCASIALAVR